MNRSRLDSRLGVMSPMPTFKNRASECFLHNCPKAIFFDVAMGAMTNV